jgi:alpha-ketoglutarate-dependent taurine dioxygenase
VLIGQEVADVLQQRGWARLPGLPCRQDNAPLLALARALGTVSMRALPWRSGLVEEEGVQRVAALAATPSDQFGKPLLSAHHTAFPLHSDEAFAARPCRYVLLHCWQADPAGGGQSLLATRERIEALADAATARALRAERLDYPGGPSVTLAPGLMRYNRQEVEGHQRRHHGRLQAATQVWLDRFDAAFLNAAERVTLAPGDLLIVDNHRTLHGRTAFAAGSPRLLKRVRVDATPG